MTFSFVRTGDPLIHAFGDMWIIISRDGAEELVRGVDDLEIILRSTIVSSGKIGEDQSIPSGIGHIIWASSVADDICHLIKYNLSVMKGFVFNYAVQDLLLKGVELIVTAVLRGKAFSESAG